MYAANITVTANQDVVMGTGYDKDKVITPARYETIAELVIKADTLEKLQEKIEAHTKLVEDHKE